MSIYVVICRNELYGNGFLTAKKGNLENLRLLVHKLSLQWLPSTILFLLFIFHELERPTLGGRVFSCCTISCILNKKEKGGFGCPFCLVGWPGFPSTAG